MAADSMLQRLRAAPDLLRSTRLYWWPGANVGDALSPLIVGGLTGRPVRFSAVFGARPLACQLVAVGSVAEHLPATYRGWIWGTGCIRSGPPLPLPRAGVAALRGPLTAARLGRADALPYGDPGLLVPRVLPGLGPDGPPGSGGLTIVPHAVDLAAVRAWAAGTDPGWAAGVRIVDVTGPPEQVIREIAAADRIVSSSLHGLVLADAFGIPSRWAVLSDQVWGEGFKFADYYAGYGQDPPEPARPDADRSLVDWARRLRYAAVPESRVAAVQRRLLDAFPLAGA